MIITVTPNPSIDRTVLVDTLSPGEVNRATTTRVDPGGKGVNVARALVSNGCPAQAILPLGGPDGELLARLLTQSEVPFIAVPIPGNTRTNIAVVDPQGCTTKINEPGPRLGPAELSRLAAAIPVGSTRIALCGSLPQGTDPSFVAELVAAHPGQVAVDTSGAPLAAAVSAHPWLVKPNREELAELVGHPLKTIGAVIGAARDLVSDGITAVVASLGADGALWVDADRIHLARATVSRPRSTVGAGDCLLAGVLSSLDQGLPPETALQVGVTWGAAAVALPGSAIPTPQDIAASKVAAIPIPNPDTILND